MSAIRTFPQVRPSSSDRRAPVRAATVKRVRYGSPAATIVCPSSRPSNRRRRYPCEGFGRSEDSMSEAGLGPNHPSRRAA